MSLADSSLALQYGNDLGITDPTDTSTVVAPSTPAPATGGGLSGLLTTLEGATQTGIGLASYAGGGSPVNLKTGIPTGTTTIAGFSLTTIVVIALLLIAVVVAIHYVTR